jgi:hypothetical protein
MEAVAQAERPPVGSVWGAQIRSPVPIRPICRKIEFANPTSKGKVSEGEEHCAILPGPAKLPSELDGSCAVQRFLVFARA